MKPLQMYYKCELFGTNDCSHRETPVLKMRESFKSFGTKKDHNERKKICNNCDKFVPIKF